MTRQIGYGVIGLRGGITSEIVTPRPAANYNGIRTIRFTYGEIKHR